MSILAAVLPAAGALHPADHPLFAGDAVHEIHLDFAQTDWWEQLTHNFEDFDDPPYLAAAFSWNGVALDSIGVRFKGNSSYWGYYGQKKSFKLDLDEFVAGQELAGLDKLNLNNCYLDPSFVREKSAYELCRAAGLAVPRANHAALFINGRYWGLYLLVEQVDQEFIESRWGGSEDGNLWKGDPGGSLVYLGPDETSYHPHYELKTNEGENDWSALVDLAATLNNTPPGALRDSLHNRADLNSALAMLAVDNLAANLDSYPGSGHNYYLYHRDLDGRFVFTTWDMNEAWGVFNMGLSLQQLRQLNPHWLPPAQPRPLAARLWQVPELDQAYLGHLRRLMAGAAHPDTLLGRMEALRELIRPWALADTLMMFSPAQFEAALDADLTAPGGPPPGRLIPGLRAFINARHSWLTQQIGAWTPPAGLVINELMASNTSTVADEAGDYDDWIEVLNRGDTPLDLAGVGLSDHWEGEADFVFPALVLPPGGRVLVWADEEPGEGPLHAGFKLDADGEDLYLVQGGSIIDEASWIALSRDLAWGRWPDGGGSWQRLSLATPGEANQNPAGAELPVLFINEFVARNQTGFQDETGAREDWLELFNPGPALVDLGGLFLTDDLANSTKWMLPDTLLPGGAFLLVWCDEDPQDGPLHTNFKLGASGEEIGLFGRLDQGNGLIDSRVFGPQTTDQSEGRLPDGGALWTAFPHPSPGATNLAALSGLTIQHQPAAGQLHLSWTPAPGPPAAYRIYGAPRPDLPFPQAWSLLGEAAAPAWSTSLPGPLLFYRVTALY
jgi:hypothetical protein